MAQIVLGPLVANIAGSIAGTTFQRGPGIHTVRKKPLPITRSTAFTTSRRTALAHLNMRWQALTSGQRGDWQTQASAITWTDRFGNTIPGKGYWQFLRCNLNKLTVGELFSDAPGTIPTFPAWTDLALECIAGAKFNIDWTLPASTGSSDYTVITATPPGSAGRSAAFGTYRVIAVLTPGKSPPQDFYAEYLARFNQPGIERQRSFAKVYFVEKFSGMASAPQILTDIWH